MTHQDPTQIKSERPRILIVEDDEMLREVLAETFVEEGFGVAVAENGKAALDHVRDDPPDVILLDVQMPVMDGEQFATHYQARHAAPIICFSSREPDVSMLEKCAHFFKKPFDLEHLVLVVQDYYRGSELDQDASGTPETT